MSNPAKTKAVYYDVKSGPLPVKVTSGHDDGAEVWIHRGYFERKPYCLYCRAKKSRWGFKDQASTRSSGDYYGLLESHVFLPG